MDAGLDTQKPRNPGGNGSMSSQRTTPASARSAEAASRSLLTTSNHVSAWLSPGTRSIQRRFDPNSKTTDGACAANDTRRWGCSR